MLTSSTLILIILRKLVLRPGADVPNNTDNNHHSQDGIFMEKYIFIKRAGNLIKSKKKKKRHDKKC